MIYWNLCVSTSHFHGRDRFSAFRRFHQTSLFLPIEPIVKFHFALIVNVYIDSSCDYARKIKYFSFTTTILISLFCFPNTHIETDFRLIFNSLGLLCNSIIPVGLLYLVYNAVIVYEHIKSKTL